MARMKNPGGAPADVVVLVLCAFCSFCLAATQAVAQGMADFFTNMSLDLQGEAAAVRTCFLLLSSKPMQSLCKLEGAWDSIHNPMHTPLSS
jgi:hypothetical protein